MWFTYCLSIGGEKEGGPSYREVHEKSSSSRVWECRVYVALYWPNIHTSYRGCCADSASAFYRKKGSSNTIPISKYRCAVHFGQVQECQSSFEIDSFTMKKKTVWSWIWCDLKTPIRCYTDWNFKIKEINSIMNSNVSIFDNLSTISNFWYISITYRRSK